MAKNEVTTYAKGTILSQTYRGMHFRWVAVEADDGGTHVRVRPRYSGHLSAYTVPRKDLRR